MASILEPSKPVSVSLSTLCDTVINSNQKLRKRVIFLFRVWFSLFVFYLSKQKHRFFWVEVFFYLLWFPTMSFSACYKSVWLLGKCLRKYYNKKSKLKCD